MLPANTGIFSSSISARVRLSTYDATTHLRHYSKSPYLSMYRKGEHCRYRCGRSGNPITLARSHTGTARASFSSAITLATSGFAFPWWLAMSWQDDESKGAFTHFRE